VHQGSIHEQLRLVGEGNNMQVLFVDWGHTMCFFKQNENNRIITLGFKIPELIAQLRAFVGEAMISSFAIELLKIAKADSQQEFLTYYHVIQDGLNKLKQSNLRDSRTMGMRLENHIETQFSKAS
jgi:hypothetical protein